MFEIIMLLAFLLVVTSQFLPGKHARNKLTVRKTSYGKKKRRGLLQKSSKRPTPARGNAERRSRNYAYAA